MKTLAASLALALALGASQANCFAAPVADDEAPARQINYADLNLARPADAAVLYRRIEGAASLLCETYSSRDLARNLRFRHCVANAVDRAVADVHAPLLSQRHAVATKRQTAPPQAMRLAP